MIDSFDMITSSKRDLDTFQRVSRQFQIKKYLEKIHMYPKLLDH